MSALSDGAALYALRVRKGRVDALEALPYHRARFIQQRRAGHELQFTEYGWSLRLAMRPTLHTLAQCESDIAIVGIYRDMLAAQTRAAA